MNDMSSLVVHKTAAILAACKSALGKVDGYLETAKTKPDISYELLKMLVLADDLLQLAVPDMTPGEFHGFSKDVVAGAKRAATFRDEKGWDFAPWFGEKVSRIKESVKSTYEYWEKDPQQMNLSPSEDMSPSEWVREGILGGLRQVKAYAEVVFSMVCTDLISICSDEVLLNED